MRQALALFITVLIISSCGQAEKFPEFVTEKVPLEELKVEEGVNIKSQPSTESISSTGFASLDTLQKLKESYFEKEDDFDLLKYNLIWRQTKNGFNSKILPSEEAVRWYELTGFLFQLTGDAEVAGELEKVVYTSPLSGNHDPEALVAPYIFTRKGDHVHVNLFFPAEISYNHSLNGGVKISLQTEFPRSGRISLNFGMETKRYIELWIRIPEWAHDATVTVKGVKYLSHPGSYSRIAKQWKEGDQVDVVFSLQNRPAYLK
jgi:hypothetical protein